MSKESSNEREIPEGAAGASGGHGRPSGEHGRPSGEHIRPSGDPAGGLPPRADRPIQVDAEQLTIGELDLLAAREVLAELGARGSAPLDSLDIDGTMTLLETIVGLEGALESLRARTAVHLEDAVKADCLRREESPRQAALVARAEASRALKSSRAVAGRTLATSRRLVRSMPGMISALSSARMLPQSAHKVGSVLGPATPEQRRQVDAILTSRLAELEGCGPQQWGDEAARILHALDPAGAAARHQAAKRERHVTVRRTDHGMARITALVPGIDGARIRKGLDVAAESARAQGDRRGHQQIMADLFADALIGRGDGIDPTTLDVGIVITDRSLLAPAHADAALVEGFGSVPYDHVREEMLRAAQAEEDADLALTIRQLYADLDHGDLVAVESRSRAFPAALTRFLTLAHQTCRGPHCDAPIRQIDHITPWSQGGATSLDNGNGLCAACNQKELAGETARVVRDEDGVRRTVRWTTRHGRSATRGAINLDPLGTYRRRCASASRASDTDVPRSHATAEHVARERMTEHRTTGERVDRRCDAINPGNSGRERLPLANDEPGELMTLQRALTDLRLRLTDIPDPHRIHRLPGYPGDWIVRRGSRGR